MRYYKHKYNSWFVTTPDDNEVGGNYIEITEEEYLRLQQELTTVEPTEPSFDLSL